VLGAGDLVLGAGVSETARTAALRNVGIAATRAFAALIVARVARR